MNELQKLLLKYPDKPWNWYWLSCNSNITMDFIEKYPDNPWNRNAISRNPNITLIGPNVAVPTVIVLKVGILWA